MSLEQDDDEKIIPFKNISARNTPVTEKHGLSNDAEVLMRISDLVDCFGDDLAREEFSILLNRHSAKIITQVFD